VAFLAVPIAWAAIRGLAAGPQSRDDLKRAFDAGNWKVAHDGYRRRLLDPKSDPKTVGEDLKLAVQCLQQLGRIEEFDDLAERAAEAHAAHWRLLAAAAEAYRNVEHQGHIVAGKFARGGRRGGGQYVHSFARDRVRAIQLVLLALDQGRDEPDHASIGRLWLDLGRLLTGQLAGVHWSGEFAEAWRLQYLTDLSQLPDYEPGWYAAQDMAAPVANDGQPIYYRTPKNFETAANDGERWRWALAQAVELSAPLKNEARWELARFCQDQFGEQTMAPQRQFGRRGMMAWGEEAAADDDERDESGPYAVHTLDETETLARLASGIKRFKLPDEFNHITIYQQIAADPQTGYGAEAIEALAQVFENRRQYEKAAGYWRRVIEQYGAHDHRRQRLDQIVGHWGTFEQVRVQPAGSGATVDLRFRNGKRVHFEAHAILVEKLLNDVKAYLKNPPQQLDWNRINIGNIGYMLVERDQKQYLSERVAAWDLALEPRPGHWDRRITVTTPLQKAGAYLLVAKMDGGNTSRIIVWVDDTVIAKKPLDGGTHYFVADATTGQPIARANLELFGFRQQYLDGPRWRVDTANFAELTNADGQASVPVKDGTNNFQWVVIARTKEGRFAHLGFTNVWRGRHYDPEYNQVKVFTITDRPVYRPKQKVQFKFWVRHAKYDQPDRSDFANQSFAMEIRNPKNERVFTKTFKADAFGGFDGEFELPDDATLGMYRLFIPNEQRAGMRISGGGSFRVEEYKKPEFDVTVDAPTEPVTLGEKVTATIRAKYYFGSPVTRARVKYKVLRTPHTQTWYPPAPWDWFYGPGYWWFANDYTWYPGWRSWGCMRPMPWWWNRPAGPPEVVADRETEIGDDGTVRVEIDTAVAQAVHPNQDHSYQITAEVVDQSRRTIVGAGNVLVARRLFKVFVWLGRGYLRAGDAIPAELAARTLDGKPVQGRGQLQLFRITYNEKAEPREQAVEQWELDTNAEGRATQQFKAATGGQYRLSYKLSDAKKHTIEGGYVFTVVGPGFDAAAYRFNDLELVTEKREYQPGDTVRLQINTNRTDSAVLLFVRPSNGVYLPPKLLRLSGKSTIEEIAVVQRDMPNFFVEAVTISGGKLHSETREIVVPPENRVLQVAVAPSRESYKPGQKATVQLKLTDVAGRPFVGSTVLAIYDKSVEYIAGGSNVPEIRSFFWKWRRRHQPHRESNLDRQFANLLKSGETPMTTLGVFGHLFDLVTQTAAAPLGETRMRGRALGGALGAPAAAMEAKSQAAGFGGGADDALGRRLEKSDAGADAAPEPLVQPIVRTQFADTALWIGSLTTREDGTAECSLTMPENLTAWKVRVWGMGHGTKVGQGDAEVTTRKDLIVRLQAPRFFVEKDEVVLSANVHNYLQNPKRVRVELELDGGCLEPLAAAADSSSPQEAPAVQTVAVEPSSEARVDWRVRVRREGTAVVRMKALSDEESDAMEMRFPVYVHGMLKTESWAGSIRPDRDTARLDVRVPKERRISDTRLEIRYSPTLAGAMVDALPYLADYPYGCTEQTLNRFLPTVITQKILLDMGLDLKAIEQKRTNLNAQEIGDDAARAKQWKRFDRNPVFDADAVRDMVKSGVQRLGEMQCGDGGWGWFSGWGEHSWPHTTALVVHGLQIARRNDVALVPGVLDRGVAWLQRHQDNQIRLLKNAATRTTPFKDHADNLDAMVYMVLVNAGVSNAEMRDFLYRDRIHLAVYAKAMFGLALEKQADRQRLDMILQNIAQFLVQDDENQTAYLRLPDDNHWWYWYGSAIEANAYYLKLLARTDPKGEVAPRLVKYLLNNRKHATYWASTRDTAVAIEAFADYFRARGEDRPDMAVEIAVDGKKQKEVRITAADLFTFDNKLVLVGDAVSDGAHQIEFTKRGRGPLYFNTYLTNFTLEDHITRAGLEVRVNRKFYKLTPSDKSIKVAGSKGRAVDQKVEKYDRTELANLAALKSGELVEIELEIDSKNDYEYLVFEDMKAAGFEPVDLRSGYSGSALGAYVEFRDERVVFFVRALPRGKHSVSYRMRAETPGRFAALPTRASAMYAPELRGNSDEIRLEIRD
jgi:hypothetical protein